MTSVWDGLVGQSAAIGPLRDGIAGAMSHAWLITGPPGSGRSNAARAFAAALLCEADGCDQCLSCRTTRDGTHADVVILAADKVLFTIDQMRELVLKAQRAPSVGKWRIIIVEDADRMTSRTANVLLKAIEEPPKHTVWVLCAPTPMDVSATVFSRCRRVQLATPPLAAVAELLVSEGIETQRARECAHAAQGHIGIARRLSRSDEAWRRRNDLLGRLARMESVGDAVVAAKELADWATAAAAQYGSEQVERDQAELLRVSGLSSADKVPPHLRTQLRDIAEGGKRRATRAARDVLEMALADLVSLYRDVLIVQLGGQVAAINLALVAVVAELAANLTPQLVLERVDAIAIARSRLAANVPHVLVLEALFIAVRCHGPVALQGALPPQAAWSQG